MIATAAAGHGGAGVRRIRFVPRPNVPVDAACVVANGVREALRAVLDAGCALTIGEPVALDAPAWSALTREALAFATPGRATDVVFVLTRRDARRLLRAAFGEEAAADESAWSELEAGAMERIVARCANACEALCVERRGPTATVDAARIPRPEAYFDIRVAAPIALTLGVGIVRDLPPASPASTIPPGALGGVPLELRAVLGSGALPVSSLLDLHVGSLVPLRTKVAGEGELKLAGQRIAFGTCGVRNGHTAFEVRSIAMRGDA